MARGGVSAVNEYDLKPHDAQVEGHGGQSTESTSQNRHCQQALPLAWNTEQQPSVETSIQSAETRPIT